MGEMQCLFSRTKSPKLQNQTDQLYYVAEDGIREGARWVDLTIRLLLKANRRSARIHNNIDV